MIQIDDSLLKYDDPVLVKRTASNITKHQSHQGRHLRLSPRQSVDSDPTPPPPRSTSTSFQATMLENGFLIIFPPRKWVVGNQLWVQQVSRTPSGKADVQQLVKRLDTKLQQRQAKPTGICPLRRELYSQCFDEVIRQVANNCAVRGLLLAEVRYEISRTITIYQALYECGIAFGMMKALQDENADMEQRISELEEENRNLRQQLNLEKAHSDENKQKQADETQVEEQNFSEEIQFLKEINQQYQALLESLMTPK